MKKKWLLGLAALTVLFAAVGFVGCGGSEDGGDNAEPQAEMEYELSADGTYYILKGIGTYTGTDIVIPSEYQGKPVKEIAAHAFNGEQEITSVVIGDKVEIIGENNFKTCVNMKSIVISASVTEIGRYSLQYNDYLTKIEVSDENTAFKDIDGNLYTKDGKTLIQYAIGKTATEYVSPEGLETIGEGAFKECENLTSVEINCKTIGESAFQFCKKLESVTLNVTEMEYGVFFGCESLARVEFGKSVETIGESIFHECDAITDVYYNGTIEDWCKITFNSSPKRSAANLYFYNSANSEYELLGDILIIPDTVTEIKANAFGDCKIRDIVIGENVTSFGDWAFAYFDINNVYYTCEESEVNRELDNRFYKAKRYYFSTEPIYDGEHWHYDENGLPTPWV
ncbi:MAG: leucine-rich repeat domain-containing protein [Clostridia bacterium]|nr:leucine-rich repeat domain-containing protein [Clostridia bacterium]